jgi:rhamnosyltransferase subunit B
MSFGCQPLRFLFNPWGTAGDVHPYVAVGMELKKRGHEVFVFSNALFQNVVEKHNLNFVPIGEPIALNQIRNDSQIHKSRTSWKAAMKWGATGTMRSAFEQIKVHAVPGRTVMGAPVWSLGARIAREALQLPLVNLIMNPFILRSTILPPITPGMYMPDWMPRWMKLEQYWFGDTFVVEPLLGREVNAFRTELGLPSIRRFMNRWWFSPDQVLGLFHELYVPRPPDWPCQVQFVGHTLWDPAGDAEVNASVQHFLDDGSPPVCFVPGSVGPSSNNYYSIATEACRAAGLRGLILDKADSKLVGSLPSFMKQASYSPLGDVLQKCQAIVHSGCMGTSAQALQAGLPHVVNPRVNDQPDMARRLERLGVARTLPVRKFRIESLVEQLQGILSDLSVKTRCEEVRQHVMAYPPATAMIADCFEKQAASGLRGE